MAAEYGEKEKLTTSPMEYLRTPGMDSKRSERGRMFVVPMFSQKRVFEDWISGFDCWFMKFDSCPLSELLGKMVATLKKPKTKIDNLGA